jgi:hypothetical protein
MKNYLIYLILFTVLLFFESINIWTGKDPREGEKFRNKFLIKNKLLLGIIIIKPRDSSSVLLFDYIVYFVSLINFIVLLLIHVIYWITSSQFLKTILLGKVYTIYSIIVLCVLFFLILFKRVIGLYFGKKEKRF